MSMNPVLPNFLVIGVQRSATTWLFECLREHPDIFMPAEKELHFFDENYQKGIEWYSRFFESVHNEKVIGEISPNYFHKPFAVDRIASDLPGAKMQIILRNPVERAYSAYMLYHERFKGISFIDAFNKDKTLRDIGLYAKHLDSIFEIIPQERINITLYDDIIRCPDEYIRQTYRYVGVDENFLPSGLLKTYNKIIFPNLQSMLVKLGLKKRLEWFKNTQVGHLLKGSIRKNEPQKKKRKLAHEEYLKAIFRFYEEDIAKLELLIGTDLSSWKK